jgi:hypothetical protein
LVKANQFSGIGSEAGIRMADLEEKFPQLAKTNTPAATIPPNMMNLQALTNRAQTGATNVIRRVLTNTVTVPSGGAPSASVPKATTTTPAAPAKP